MLDEDLKATFEENSRRKKKLMMRSIIMCNISEIKILTYNYYITLKLLCMTISDDLAKIQLILGYQ